MEPLKQKASASRCVLAAHARGRNRRDRNVAAVVYQRGGDVAEGSRCYNGLGTRIVYEYAHVPAERVRLMIPRRVPFYLYTAAEEKRMKNTRYYT